MYEHVYFPHCLVAQLLEMSDWTARCTLAMRFVARTRTSG
jgi:hypothetical protein